jgi:hypothetical protein
MVAKAKRSMEDVATVDGVKYRWQIHREPQWATVDGGKGLCISVQHEENPQKVLLLEYPFPKPSRHAQRPKVSKHDVAVQIGKAIEAGWEPESRGKPFTYMIEA